MTYFDTDWIKLLPSERPDFPEIPYKIGEPLEIFGSAAKVDKSYVKGGRSPPFLYNAAYLKE